MSRSWNHQAYAQMLWGDALNHQVESFIVGMGLMRHSPTSRRILWATDEVRDSGISEILGTIWQSETLQHLNTGLEGAHASRLSKVWTKLKIWEVACCEEVPCSSRAYPQSPLWRVEACLLQMESSDAESSLEALKLVCAIDPDSVKPGNFDFTPHVEERTANQQEKKFPKQFRMTRE